MKNKYFILALVLSGYFLSGCATSALKQFKEDSPCPTVAEGFYEAAEKWNMSYRTPAIIIKSGNKQVYKVGTVINNVNDTVVFQASKHGFSTPKPERYSLSDVVAIVDKNGNCTYGDIPYKYTDKETLWIEFSIDENPNLNKLIWELIPNESFSFCMYPGTYKVKQMKFLFDNNKNIDDAIQFPEMTFTIEPNAVNYVGKFSMVEVNNETDSNFVATNPNTIVIPYKHGYRANDAAAVGFLFGSLGTLVYNAAISASDEIDGVKFLTISDDENFAFKCKMPNVKTNLFKAVNVEAKEVPENKDKKEIKVSKSEAIYEN